MSGALVAGLLAGYGIAVPVGAVSAYLVSLTARTDLRTGACAALGVATADGLYAIAAVGGGAALTPLVEGIRTPLRWGSVLVLLALAAHTAVTALRRRGDPGRDGPTGLAPGRAYLGLLGITLLNPMTVVYFTALVLGDTDTVTGSGQRALFAIAAFTASASWQLLLAGGGALLGRGLTGPRGRLVTACASSVLIAGLAVRLALTG
ncbi:LysE/ArgO family amino acid transporter [Streptomyces xanthii]|uniref:LysE family transporter n=1 Tax=Streptomyces xanthii TaxID=2768069 RepID=A0A7H1B8B1_9ACTN|nr:LysE family transporter [Streptomyces xanthii]QNS04966.1 LysE family transporter [Streptomyces xanthii]